MTNLSFQDLTLILPANFNIANQPLNMTRTGGDLTQQFIYAYDNNFNLKSITYPLGNQDVFTYDSRNLLTGKTIGGITTLGYTHDGNGNLTHFTDGEHNVWQTLYDGHDRVIGKTDPLQNTIHYTLDNNSNLTGISGPENLLVSKQYDELNRMYRSTIANGITSNFNFDPAGNMTQYTTPNGHAWNYTPSGSGLLKAVNDPLGNASSYGYDKRALPLSVNETESGGRSLNHSISYNALGNVSSSDDSLQRKWQHHYDGNNQLPQNRVDPENGAVAYGYDALNRFNKETRYIAYKGNTVPAATVYDYDLNNNLISAKDDNANETVYQYDDKDRLTRIIYPDGRSESYTYDRNDRLLTQTDANGTLVTNVYDAAGRLTSRSITPATGVEGPTNETFAYDGLNRLERAENETSVTALVYDNAGRLIKETQQVKNGGVIVGTYEVNLDYDNNGNKTSLNYPSGKALSITPDALDRTTSIQSAGNPVAGYTYEGQVKVTGKTLGSGLRLDAQFDDGRRPIGIKYANAQTGKEIIGQTSTWNKVDLKTSLSRTDVGKLSKNFEYDSAYRLRNLAAVQDETAYEIDGADNIKQVTETKKGIARTATHDVNNRNQVIAVDGQTLTYDANGNLVQISGSGITTNYIYDYKNQLVRVSGGGTQVEFMYDALGRRVQKKAVYSSGNDVTRYVYDGLQVIEERDSANVLKARYAYGNGIDEPVEIERANSAGTLISCLPMQDTNGNVIGITDGTGKLIEKVQYDAYGLAAFIYDQEAPQVDQVRVAGGKVRIRFSEAVNEATAKDAITLKQGANAVSGSLVFEELGKLVVFESGSALAANTQYALEITTELEDVSGNKLAEAFSQAFTYTGSDLMVYDRVAPQVESVKLVDGKLGVEFSEEIDPASIAGAIELTYATGSVAGTSTLGEARTILFTPSSSLYNATEYTLAVKTTVMDLSGKALSAYSVKFTHTGKDLLIYQKPDPSEHQESSIGNSTLFQGREFDRETGLYYFRARYLHPKLGRFLQGDPKGYIDSMNPYQSFGNNPVNFSDPMGASVERDFNTFVSKEEIDAAVAHNMAISTPEKDMMILKALGRIIGGTIFELSPAGDIKDYLSLFAGKDLLWGGKLKWWEKGLALIPFINDIRKVKHFKKAADITNDLKDAVKYEGYVFRFSKADHMDDAWKIGKWNVAASHRYSRKEVGALYTSTDPLTAYKEVRKSMDTLLAYKKIKVNQICDLTNPSIRKKFGINLKDIVRKDDEAYKITQEIGDQIRELGYKGILAPSARQKSGINLILFEELK